MIVRCVAHLYCSILIEKKNQHEKNISNSLRSYSAVINNKKKGYDIETIGIKNNVSIGNEVF